MRGDEASFAAAALSIANDDQLWRRQHEAALRLQQGLSWDDVPGAPWVVRLGAFVDQAGGALQDVSSIALRGVEDLIQVGSIGLLEAIDRYETGHNTEFKTYAVHYITGHIRHYLRDPVRHEVTSTQVTVEEMEHRLEPHLVVEAGRGGQQEQALGPDGRLMYPPESQIVRRAGRGSSCSSTRSISSNRRGRARAASGRARS